MEIFSLLKYLDHWEKDSDAASDEGKPLEFCGLYPIAGRAQTQGGVLSFRDIVEGILNANEQQVSSKQ
jgi:hypothetical protein